MTERRVTLMPNVDRAYAAFRDALLAGVQPCLDSSIQDGNNWREGEFDVLIRGSSVYGVLHEEIQKLLDIAERHGGRLWFDRNHQTLAILFPYEHPPGPDGEPSPAETARRKSRARKEPSQ